MGSILILGRDFIAIQRKYKKKNHFSMMERNIQKKTTLDNFLSRTSRIEFFLGKGKEIPNYRFNGLNWLHLFIYESWLIVIICLFFLLCYRVFTGDVRVFKGVN